MKRQNAWYLYAAVAIILVLTVALASLLYGQRRARRAKLCIRALHAAERYEWQPTEENYAEASRQIDVLRESSVEQRRIEAISAYLSALRACNAHPPRCDALGYKFTEAVEAAHTR